MINIFNNKKKRNIGFQTLHKISSLVNQLRNKTQDLNMLILPEVQNPTSSNENKKKQFLKFKAQYQEILKQWEMLKSLEHLYPFKQNYPNGTIITIFSAYQKQTLQKEPNSYNIMIENLQLLDKFLTNILNGLKKLEKNYDFQKEKEYN